MIDAHESVTAKLERLASGDPAHVLDLFAGCWGPSLRFQVAGYLPVAGVGCDRHATTSYVPPLFAQALATTMRTALAQAATKIAPTPETG